MSEGWAIITQNDHDDIDLDHKTPDRFHVLGVKGSAEEAMASVQSDGLAWDTHADVPGVYTLWYGHDTYWVVRLW